MSTNEILYKSGDKINTECPLCSSTNNKIIHSVKDWQTLVSKKEFFVAKCMDCSLLYLYPFIDNGELLLYYPERYFSKANIFSLMVKNFLYKREVKYFKKILPENANIMEVGCGIGEFLVQAEKYSDFNLFAIEQNEFALNEAKKKVNAGIINASIADADLPQEKYDLVIMRHVLEHLQKPFDVLKKIRRSIKPGGYLLLGLPFSDSIETKVYKRFWAGWDAPRHITYFTVRKLKEILTNMNFKVVRIDYDILPNYWISSIRNFLIEKKLRLLSLLFNDKRNVVFLTLFLMFSIPSALFRIGGQGKFLVKKI